MVPPFSPSFPPPSLLCVTLLSLDTEWMKTLSGESETQKQPLRNVSKANGDQGGWEKPEQRILGTGGNPAPRFTQGGGNTLPLRIYLTPSNVHTCKHIPPVPPPEGKRRPQTQEVMPPYLPPPAPREQRDGGPTQPWRGVVLCPKPSSIGGFSQRPLLSLWEPFRRAVTGNPHPQLTGPKPALFREGEGSDGTEQRRLGREVEGAR